MLSDYVAHVLAEDADDAEATAEWVALTRRHLGWSRWATRRDEWTAWQNAQPESERPKSGPWALANRTSAHPNYADQYAKLPSHTVGWERSKKQRPARWAQENKIEPVMLGIDCEMCETDVDPRALVGVSVVNTEGKVLIKELVKPPGNIVDLKTDITGLTKKHLKGVTTTLKDIQERLRKLVGPETILVGHGLVHDLKALKFDHLPVIDTAMLFRYKNLPRSTPGLADLCKRLLSSDMRAEGTHDSVEDAKMALELAKWEAEHGPTPEMDPPEDKVDARDLVKLFVHRMPRGTCADDIKGMFEKANGTCGVDHAASIKAVHGKFLGPETAVDPARTTSAYIEFETVDAANMAFKSLRGANGTDALGRPQKAVKMVVKAGAQASTTDGTTRRSSRIAAKKETEGEDGKEEAVAEEQKAATTRTVMVRKMAAHQGRAIGTVDKNNEPGRQKRKVAESTPGSEEKKPRRYRPPRRARLAAKGIIV